MDWPDVDIVARIAWLAGSGATADEIAGDSRIRIEPSRIKFVIDRLDLPRLTQISDPMPVRLTVPRSMIEVLDRAASVRGIGRADMAARILKAVLGDGIVDAVVDDGVVA